MSVAHVGSEPASSCRSASGYIMKDLEQFLAEHFNLLRERAQGRSLVSQFR